MQDTTSNIHDWNLPLPLEEVPLLPWPENVFPAPFDKFVKELARSTETPIELSAMLTLAAVATAAQKKYFIQIKSDYFERVNIWPVIILPPASRKSRVFSEITAPLKMWEYEQKKVLEPLIQSETSRRKTMEVRLKELRNTAAKTNEEPEYKNIQEKIELLEKELCEIPVFPQIWTSDVTPEHLGTIMAANDEAMAVLSDEGGIFDILGGLYSDGKANIDLFLQSHSASSVRVDRGSRPPIFMQRAVLTMGLTVQPEVIRNICRNKTFRGRGLLGRFLYAMPKSNIGSRNFNEASMSREHIQLYQDALKGILNQPYNIVDGINSLYGLSMTSEAYEKWLEHAKAIEVLMGEDMDYLTHISDWAGKLPGTVARISGLLHIMRYAKQKPWEQPISLDDMTAAVKIGHALINHALAVFDLLQQDNAMQVARNIVQWLKKNKIERLTRRDFKRKFRRLKEEELNSSLEILKEKEILREAEDKLKKIGRPSDVFDVNPHIF